MFEGVLGVLGPGEELVPGVLVNFCILNFCIFLCVCPLVCSWYLKERVTFTPRRLKNALKTREMNCGP